MPHLSSENIRPNGLLRKLITVVLSLILCAICAVAFSVVNAGGPVGAPYKHSHPATVQETEISISGYVKNQFGAGVAGAQAILTGSYSQATTTDASGLYSFTVPGGVYPGCSKSYTVSVTIGGFFIGGRSSGGCFSSDISYDDIIYTAPYNITFDGFVKNSKGVGVGGVLFTLTGSDSQTTYSDAAGHYSFTVPAGVPPNCYREYFVTASVGERVIAQISSSGCLTYNFTYDDIIYDPPAPDPTPTPTLTPTPTPPPPPPPCEPVAFKGLALQIAIAPCPTPTPTPTPTPEPLIFVPGASGSALDEELPNGTRVNRWPGNFRRSNLERLNLDPTAGPLPKIIATDVLRKVTLVGVPVRRVYENLLDALVSQGGYREYKVDGKPERRTTAGCDLSQKSDDPNSNPNLFVFAYDWRLSNADNAVRLKDYVGCVQQFYPGSDVNILAHSMGGLLARRYILDNIYNHSVHKFITIGSPFLGAPKAIDVMTTGRFFDSFVDWFTGDQVKQLALYSKGVHELLPSAWYHKLGGRPLSEGVFDDGGKLKIEARSYDYLYMWMNSRFSRSVPYNNSGRFHAPWGQDDWREDPTAIEYHHIIGFQRYDQTIGKVIAVPSSRKPATTARTAYKFSYAYTNGDGTVPLLSASRAVDTDNLNAGNAEVIALLSLSKSEDKKVEHTGLTQNPVVHSHILSILKDSQQQNAGGAIAMRNGMAAASAQERQETPMRVIKQKGAGERAPIQRPQYEDEDEESYQLSIDGGEIVEITDDKGNRTRPVGDVGLMFDDELDISRNGGSDSPVLIIPTDREYLIKFHPTEGGTAIELLKGHSKTVDGLSHIQPTLAIRYNDLTVPAGVTAMLKITPQGMEDLRYDLDGDGVFEKTVSPTASVAGALALDMDMPSVTFSEQMKGGKRVVTINAVDEGSGIKKLLYSVDGVSFQPYTKPLHLDPTKQPAIYAYADDNVANRSPLVTYQPLTSSVAVSRDERTGEILVTITIRNEGTAPVFTNFVLQTAELNNKPTTSTLPINVEMLAPGKPLIPDSPPPPDKSVVRTLRFPATAAEPGKSAMLSGSGTSHGEKFHEQIKVAVP